MIKNIKLSPILKQEFEKEKIMPKNIPIIFVTDYEYNKGLY